MPCVKALSEPHLQFLTIFLGFVRTAHYWTKTHSDLNFEEDISLLLKTHEALAESVLNDPEAKSSVVSAYEALYEADRRKGEFLAMLAHELRNPLSAIRNAVQILLRADGDAQTVRSASEILDRQVGHMVRQVDDLLDLSRINQGKIELRKVRVELASVVNHALEFSRPICDGMGHELTVTLAQEAMYIHGDSIRLAQVVGNLLNNACKFTDRGGRVTLVGRARRRTRGRPNPGHRSRHRGRPAGTNLRVVRPGRYVAGEPTNRAGDRTDTGQESRGDARRDG